MITCGADCLPSDKCLPDHAVVKNDMARMRSTLIAASLAAAIVVSLAPGASASVKADTGASTSAKALSDFDTCVAIIGVSACNNVIL